jgi:GntR family transcriptional regulator of vanillate catabolism
MVLNGKLAPGQRVAEAPLADLLGVSRTPVRQALPVLALEGLLVENETRGYLVRAFTPPRSPMPSTCVAPSKPSRRSAWPNAA